MAAGPAALAVAATLASALNLELPDPFTTVTPVVADAALLAVALLLFALFVAVVVVLVPHEVGLVPGRAGGAALGAATLFGTALLAPGLWAVAGAIAALLARDVAEHGAGLDAQLEAPGATRNELVHAGASLGVGVGALALAGVAVGLRPLGAALVGSSHAVLAALALLGGALALLAVVRG
jgi:hypothetical protein